jgi:signal transduction histidine kinase
MDEAKASDDKSRILVEFISAVTDELRTPLLSIRAIAETLQEDPRMHLPQRAKFLGIMIEDSKRLMTLVNQVVDFAKIESDNAEWHSTDLDLVQVIDDAAVAAQQILEENAVILTIEMPEAVPLVTADRERLIQVLMNLISNAARFCDKADRQVTITLSQESQALRVDVKDNGQGIRPEDQQIIFEKFRHAGDMLGDAPQGTGLGLSISRKIVSHFGGRMWVESALGQGATFSFTVPLPRR